LSRNLVDSGKERKWFISEEIRTSERSTLATRFTTGATMNAIFASLTRIVEPFPKIFATDLARYLIAATLITIVLALVGRRFRERRAVRTRTPYQGQRRKEFLNSFITAAVFGSVGLGVYHGSNAGIFHIYGDAAQFGWPYWVFSLILIIGAHDTYFYWVHRFMHRRAIFPWMHRIHHQSYAPTQWAAYSFSIGEAFAQALFLPLFLLIIPVNLGVILLWGIHQVLRNAAGHAGVELMPARWLAGWWGQWLTTTLHHDLHHAQGRYNYGLYFTWWDRLCGTEHPRYRDRLWALIGNIVKEPSGNQVAIGQGALTKALATLLFVSCLGFAGGVRAESIVDDWATQGYSARVRISTCAQDANQLCGTITWLWEAVDAGGRPVLDRNNPDPSLRSQGLVGLSILKGFHATSSGEWNEGTIYDPESGRTYKSKVRLRNADILEVSGCVLFVCRSQIWRRAGSTCSRSELTETISHDAATNRQQVAQKAIEAGR
jgi:lathosterol oxidase